MIIVAYNLVGCNSEDVLRLRGKETVPCPICGGKLKVHGSCRRKLQIASNETVIYHLRVMKCCTCGKTHRELPDGVIPYKRMSADYFTQVSNVPTESALDEHELADVESSTWRRVVSWMRWFIRYVDSVLAIVGFDPLPATFCIGNIAAGQTEHFVRLVVNSGFWIQHRSA